MRWIAPAGGRDRREPDGNTPDSSTPRRSRCCASSAPRRAPERATTAQATSTCAPVAKEKSIGEERMGNARAGLGEGLDVDPATASWAQGLPEGADLTQALADHLWDKVDEEYKAIEACNVPGGGDVPLPEGAIRPVRPPSVPTF